MAQLLHSKYTPGETVVTRRNSNSAKDFLNLKYEFKEISGGYYKFTKPAVLEMVFQENDEDFVFCNMLDAMSKYIYSKRRANEEEKIYDLTVEKFVEFIASGKIKVTILPNGSYTLE